MHIAFMGGSCAGKTTTARLVAERTGAKFVEGRTHLEPEFIAEAPYEHRDAEPLAAEKLFVDWHASYLAEVERTGGTVTDVSLESDLAYGLALLQREHYDEFAEYVAEKMSEVDQADLVVLLDAPVEVQIFRKGRRFREEGRPDDRQVDPRRLARINQAHRQVAEELGPRAAVVKVRDNFVGPTTITLECLAQITRRLG